MAQLRSWGFNSLGPFSDESEFAGQMPYSVQLSMASGNDWFAPSFVTNADDVAATQVAPLADDPNLIGWYTDSELTWGPDIIEHEHGAPGLSGVARRLSRSGRRAALRRAPRTTSSTPSPPGTSR